MSLHAWNRLHRPIVGHSIPHPELRPLAARIWGRDKEPRMFQPVLTGKKALPEVKIRKPRKIAETRPNAPLLKRVMRRRFALDTTKGRRAAMREPVPWALLTADRVPFVSDQAKEAWPKIAFTSPIAANRELRSLDRIRPRSGDALVAKFNKAGGSR